MELTNAALAAAIGVSERRVAAVKGEERLPLTPSGKIDGAALLRTGWAAQLERNRTLPWPEPTEEQRKQVGMLAPVLDFSDPHNRGFALAVTLALYEMPTMVAIALSEAGADRKLAEAAIPLALILFWQAMNDQAEAFQIGKCDEGGPILAQGDMVMGWKDRANWERLFPSETPPNAPA